MGQEIHFNLNEIVVIKFVKERVATNFVWEDGKPIKKFFGLIDTGRFTESGFKNIYSYYDDICTEEGIKESGYKVYSKDERLNDRIANYPYVEIHLKGNNSVTKKFKSDAEASEFIRMVERLSKCEFGIIEYGND